MLNELDNDLYLKRSIRFDPNLSDETVAECIAPYVPVEIQRNDGFATVIYYGEENNTHAILNRFDEAVLESEMLAV